MPHVYVLAACYLLLFSFLREPACPNILWKKKKKIVNPVSSPVDTPNLRKDPFPSTPAWFSLFWLWQSQRCLILCSGKTVILVRDLGTFGLGHCSHWIVLFLLLWNPSNSLPFQLSCTASPSSSLARCYLLFESQLKCQWSQKSGIPTQIRKLPIRLHFLLQWLTSSLKKILPVQWLTHSWEC